MENDNTKEQQATRRTWLVACVTALVTAFTIALPLAAQDDIITPPPVPAGLEVSDANEAFLLGRGVGTQNYICVPATTIGHVAWTLFTPQATLFSDEAEQLTTHFSSPNPDEDGVVRVSWQDSRDTSRVWARLDTPSSDPNFVAAGAIPWLLLEAVGKQVGPLGGNTLAVTTFIQRLNTVGGVAPSTGCNLPTDIGNRRFVPYAADYLFYRKK
ncbi:MAG TPA: DUF3455 domain-containing protein [Vicinamibacterales bacterium]|nr:DUF3455 domain-containing protein [Vicinamibacterales bacterium]